MTSSRSRSRSRSHSLGSICLDDTFLRNQVLRSLTRKHLSAVSATCVPYMHQYCLGCCLRRLRLMETPVCGACGMSTVHAPALSGMPLTALTVNGNTSLRCLRHVNGTCPALSGMPLTALTVNGNTSLRCLRHVNGTCPALSGMPLTALTVNGNTSLRCLRHVNGTCPSTVWDAAYGAYG